MVRFLVSGLSERRKDPGDVGLSVGCIGQTGDAKPYHYP